MFDETLDADSKTSALENEYGLPLTREIEDEVTKMCTYATSIENKAVKKGIDQGIKQGIKQGISGAVAMLRSMNVEDSVILKKICEQYNLTEEKAKEYL